MFFIGGITQGTKELIYNAAAIHVPVLFLYSDL